AGLTAIKETRNNRGGGAPRVFELDADTEVETRDYGAMTVTQLQRLMRARQARCGAPASSVRRSSRFHDRPRVRADSPLLHRGRRYGLGIWDAMTEMTWHRRERAPSARFEFLGQLQARNPFR